MSKLNLETTGLKGLDEILQNLRKGDNVVWQVDSVEDYKHFVLPYIKQAEQDKKNIIYIRFAQHEPLLAPSEKVKIYQLDAASGFESFSKEIHNIITKEGDGAFYLFDCLSDLLSAWATDLMIGNFFMVTCPYLFKLNTIAYFAILRNNHSFKTIARIRETTQLLLDVYHFEGDYYVHPLKVWQRYSPTMYLPHQEKAGKYAPIINSVDATKLFVYMSDRGEESARRYLDYWDRLFLEAEELAKDKAKEKGPMLDELCRIMIGREPRMLALVKKHLTLEDLIEIKNRMIGTGFIGGKALGMLLARKILKGFKDKLEAHDSFYIGSDVFYTYIVQNGWWDLWLEQRTEEGYFTKAADLKEKLLNGNFPDEIKEQFNQMLEYFGQSPIIVRSSSLLEDGFGNAFAGKYESLFCVNQGTPDERYNNFEEIVRQVFASTMNEDALAYRLQRGLKEQDEQMALLVQRVSGSHYRNYFFPYLAGVGVSYNTFVWHENMEPGAGMLRLVFGLGTRAVNRVEGDYPRIVALDAPLLRPYAGIDDIKKFSQHDVDLLNIAQNELQSVPLTEVTNQEPDLKLDDIAVRDRAAEGKMKELGLAGCSWVLTFDDFLVKTDFAAEMKRMLKALESEYQYPVDMEFAANYTANHQLKINVLQCRPLQAKGLGGQVKIPAKIPAGKILFGSHGNFMGGSVAQEIGRVIVVETKAYGDLLHGKKYNIARLIGKLNKQVKKPTMLIGPGRWGTRDATLGVPVTFAEINKFSALVEVADPAAGFTPDLSFGSHFFLDLVEANIFYVALFKSFNQALFKKQINKFAELLPEEKESEKIIKVYDLDLKLLSDIASQQAVCLAR